MQRAKRGTRKVRAVKNRGALITHPPPIQEYAVRHGTRLRYVTNAAVAQDITFQELLDTMLIAVSATAGYDIFWMVKVRAVEIWSTPLLGSATTVSVNFDGSVAGLAGDQRFHTDTSMGIEPAHIKARPAKLSQAAQFQVSSSNTAFFMACPAGSVVDVELTFVQNSQAQAKNVNNALVAATTGAPYWRGLDGLAIAATKLTPIAIATI